MIEELANSASLPQINIPDLKDQGRTLYIEIPQQLKPLIRKQELFLTLHKESDLQVGNYQYPVERYKIDKQNFKFTSSPAVGNGYLLISDTKDNIYILLSIYM